MLHYWMTDNLSRYLRMPFSPDSDAIMHKLGVFHVPDIETNHGRHEDK